MALKNLIAIFLIALIWLSFAGLLVIHFGGPFLPDLPLSVFRFLTFGYLLPCICLSIYLKWNWLRACGYIFFWIYALFHPGKARGVDFYLTNQDTPSTALLERIGAWYYLILAFLFSGALAARLIFGADLHVSIRLFVVMAFGIVALFVLRKRKSLMPGR